MGFCGGDVGVEREGAGLLLLVGKLLVGGESRGVGGKGTAGGALGAETQVLREVLGAGAVDGGGGLLMGLRGGARFVSGLLGVPVDDERGK